MKYKIFQDEKTCIKKKKKRSIFPKVLREKESVKQRIKMYILLLITVFILNINRNI